MKHQSYHQWRIPAALVALVACSLAALAQVPWATQESSDRVGTTEFYGIGQYLHQDSVSFDAPEGRSVRVDMDDTGLGGLGVGYHINKFLCVRGDFMFGGAGLTASTARTDGTSIDVQRDVLITTGRLNLDFNILPGRISPFVTAGIGYQYMEMELENASSDVYCYWDPWWGYVCFEDEPYASTFDFTWNAGAGVRWNISDRLIVKAMAGANWIDYGGGSGVTTQIEAIFSVGWTF